MEHVLEHENANFVTSEKQSFTIRVKATKYRAEYRTLDFRFCHTVLYYT